MEFKKFLKSMLKSLGITAIYGLIIIFIFVIVLMIGVSEKTENIIAYGIVISSIVVYSSTLIFFLVKKEKTILKDEKMKNFKDYVIVDELRHGNSVLAIYFYKYKDNKFVDSFFFSFFNRYKFDNANIFLDKIKNFCEDFVLISDKYSNYKYLDKLFICNNVSVLENKKIAIDEYININNIRKDFVTCDIEFTPIDDVFIKMAKDVNASMTKQLFEGKLLYILSFYNSLKEAL